MTSCDWFPKTDMEMFFYIDYTDWKYDLLEKSCGWGKHNCITVSDYDTFTAMEM